MKFTNTRSYENKKTSISIRNSTNLYIFMLIAVFVQCTGPTGPMGPKGNDGQDGLDGINYTSSVIYDVDPSEWVGNIDGYNVSLNVPEITDEIYYTGTVLVYKLIEIDPKSFNLLPYIYVDNALTLMPMSDLLI